MGRLLFGGGADMRDEGGDSRFGGGLVATGLAACVALVGTSALAQPVESFGRNVPIASMIERIVPVGQRVRVEGEDVARRPVSWQPGSDWRAVVRTAVARVGLEMAEDGEGGFVVRQRPRPEAVAARPPASVTREDLPPARPFSGATPPRAAASGARGEGTPQAGAARQAERADGRWRARRGQTLEQALADWAGRAGWTLVYNTNVIHDLQADFAFSGDFIDAASSLITAVEARPVPRAVFYRGNHVLVVSTSMEDVR